MDVYAPFPLSGWLCKIENKNVDDASIIVAV